jgi:hypothetical protein
MNVARIRTLVAACAFAAAALVPGVASAQATFYGIVRHITWNAIKVDDPRTNQTLGFELLPQFNQIFSGDGKVTHQIKDIHVGQYVGIVYDQKALGIRHADKIYLLTNRNERIRP